MTFHTQNITVKKPKNPSATTGKSGEVSALLRLTKLAVSGGEVDINLIGKHESSNFPPSLFNEDGSMRAGGTKSTLIKALKEGIQVTTVSHLSQDRAQNTCIADATLAVRQWSFHKGQTFGAIAKIPSQHAE